MRTKELKRTRNGCISELYTRMQSRIRSDPRYSDRSCSFSRAEFVDWIANRPDFECTYQAWKQSGYSLKYAPSIDRIDNEGNYDLHNIQILSFGDNSRKDAPRKAVVIHETLIVGSTIEAARVTGAYQQHISSCCHGRARTANGYTFRFATESEAALLGEG